MNVEIRPNLLRKTAKLFGWEFKFLPNRIGLSEKTLRELDKGMPHKLETVHMLERFLGKNYADEPGNEIWNTREEDICGPSEIYLNTEALELVTNKGPSSELSCFALALPPSGFIKAIEERALKSYRNAYSERIDDPKVSERKKAFNNFLFHLKDAANDHASESHPHPALALQSQLNPNWLGNRLAETFIFTVSDSLLPLSHKQKACISDLDNSIKQLVIETRRSGFDIHSSFQAGLEGLGIEPYRETVKSVIARLKRLNINALIYSKVQKNRVFDGTYDSDVFDLIEEDPAGGLDSEEYLFTYETGVTHLTLVPNHCLRMRFPLEKHLIDYQPETMWAFGWRREDNKFVRMNWVSGIGQGSTKEPVVSERQQKNGVESSAASKPKGSTSTDREGGL